MKKNKVNLINVEIEVNTHCNRKCLYCPNSLNGKTDKNPMIMPGKILNKVLFELSEINYSGRISYHFYNEPLLRDDLELIIQKVHRVLPNAFQVLFTNGDFLSDERYNSLISAGLDYIVVTSHSGKKHHKRNKQFIQFPSELELTNRGGAISNLREVSEEDNRTPCYVMSEMIVITVTGDILPCYEDYNRKHCIGNIMEKPLTEILSSQEYSLIRRALELGERKNALPICSNCINRAHRFPGFSDKSEPFWEKLNTKMD